MVDCIDMKNNQLQLYPLVLATVWLAVAVVFALYRGIPMLRYTIGPTDQCFDTLSHQGQSRSQPKVQHRTHIQEYTQIYKEGYTQGNIQDLT